ncbi:TBC1 domain family member 31 [Euwallacea fornicatus]|uniref:TBC1 domain family member 31 n=1 Tax=Euwallacea fornicatus TaxID=995702 RepID=UPI00338F4751
MYSQVLNLTKFLDRDVQKKIFKLKTEDSSGLIFNLYQTDGRKSLKFLHYDFDCNGTVLALSNIDGQIFILNFVTMKSWRLKKFQLCSCIKVSEYNKNELLIGKRNGILEVVDIATGNCIEKLLGHQEAVASVSFSQNGNCITSSLNDAIIWDMANYSKLQILALEKDCALKFALFVPISNHILVCYKDDIIQMWQNESFESLKQFHPSNWRNYIVRSLTISRNGKIMVISGFLPILAMFQLDVWKLLKLISLPDHINSVKQIQFIPQNFDAGCNKLLAILAGSGVIYFYNIETNTLMSELRLKCEINSFRIPCANAQYLSCLLSNGEVELYDLSFYILKDEKPIAERAKERSFKHVSKFTSARQYQKLDIRIKQQFDSVLEIEKLKSIIKEYKEFPEAFRATIWEKLLKLPNNRKQYNRIVNNISVLGFEGLQDAFPLEDKVSIRSLSHLLNNICTWCPFFAQVEYLPYFLYPFVKIFHKKPISCFELCCTLLVNWCQHWFEYHPLPPVNILAIIDNMLIEHDVQILEHFSRYNVKPVTYAWRVLESAFSEVLSANEWLVLWDHIFVNEPSFLLCAVVAFIMLEKKHILCLTVEEEIANFFHLQTTINAKRLISKTNLILTNTSEKNHPRQYFNAFMCLEYGCYPIFTQYPKEVVNLQVKNINLLEQQLKNVRDLKYILKQKQKQFEESEMNIKNEEDRRIIEVTKACLDKMKSYQQNLISQQVDIKQLKRELIDHEREIIQDSRNKFQMRTTRKKIDGPSMSDELNIDQKIKQTQIDLRPTKKSDIISAVISMNNLISKIKLELKKEETSSNNKNTKENIKIYELEKETKNLQKETSRLLRHLVEKRGSADEGDNFPTCSGAPCFSTDSDMQQDKAVRFLSIF